MRSRPTAFAAAVLFAACAIVSTAPAAAQDDSAKAPPQASAHTSAKAPISIDAVQVTPENPAADTLCRLTVTLHNRGERPMTALGFDVSVAGHPLPVYDNQLFLKSIGPDETVDLALYNFWTSETGRPAPADGKMKVEVTLREARWLKTGEEDGVEVWTLEGPVEGLPTSGETIVPLSKPAKPK